MPKIISIVDLNQKVDLGFEEVQTRFDEVDEKFEVIGNKLDKVAEVVIDLAGQFKKFDEEQTVLAHRVSKHSNEIEELQKAVFKS